MFEHREDTVLGRLMDYLDRGIRYIVLNLAWLLLTLPFTIVFFLILRYGFGMEEFPWVLISIPIVLAAPAIGGLFYATNQLVHDKDGSLSVFWEGVKIYLWPSYRWGFLNLVVAFLLSLNIWFYGNWEWRVAAYLRVAFIVFAIFWATLQIYTFPFIIEQEEPLLKMSLRNSFIATARFPLQSFGFVVLIAVIVLVSTLVFPPLWIVISVSLIAYLSNRHTLSIIDKLFALEKKTKEAQENPDSSPGE